MTAPTLVWRTTLMHTHCAKCQELADQSVTLASVTGSLGSAHEEQAPITGEVLHAARVERDPVWPQG